jgi:osmoprotectant transport system ATP-binding protein
MDEAIRLGDKIAVMDEGKLLQYATPQDIICNPATEFVDTLIGASDRAFRLLSLTPVSDLIEKGDAEGDPISGETSLRDAYADCLWTGRDALPVVEDGIPIGRVTMSAIARSAAQPQ